MLLTKQEWGTSLRNEHFFRGTSVWIYKHLLQQRYFYIISTLGVGCFLYSGKINFLWQTIPVVALKLLFCFWIKFITSRLQTPETAFFFIDSVFPKFYWQTQTEFIPSGLPLGLREEGCSFSHFNFNQDKPGTFPFHRTFSASTQAKANVHFKVIQRVWGDALTALSKHLVKIVFRKACRYLRCQTQNFLWRTEGEKTFKLSAVFNVEELWQSGVMCWWQENGLFQGHLPRLFLNQWFGFSGSVPEKISGTSCLTINFTTKNELWNFLFTRALVDVCLCRCLKNNAFIEFLGQFYFNTDI